MQNGEKLRAIRETNKHTIKKISEIVQCNEKQVRRWEKNEAEMGVEKLQIFCKYFNVSSDYILDLSDKKSASD